MTDALPARFWRNVEPEPNSGCWLWVGAVSDGYGHFLQRRVPDASILAHRVSYEALVGQIPEGLTLDHRCRMRQCVNPAHLRPLSNRDNNLLGVGMAARNARKTHCPRGHPLAGRNLHRDPRTGQRRCRLCRGDTFAGKGSGSRDLRKVTSPP